MTDLVQIAYSPWSARARWALDHHGIAYRRVPYLPGLSELGLRRRLGRWRGKITVPVLFPDDGPAVVDSLDIARWAEARGHGAPLFPPEHEAAIADWHALSEGMLAAGRVLATRATLADPVAMAEALPPFLRPTGPLGQLVGRVSARNLLRKYDPATSTEAACTATLEQGLGRLRAALADGREHLLGAPTFADVTMVAACTFVRPPDGWPGLGPASVRAWSPAGLADRYADVLAWRDRRWAERPRRATSTER